MAYVVYIYNKVYKIRQKQNYHTFIQCIKPIIEAHSTLKIESDKGKSYSLKVRQIGQAATGR